MGSCCGKGVQVVRKHELAFMGIVSEGAYKKPDLLDEIFQMAKEEGQEDQIFNAVDEDGDLPIHKASMHGNPTCLEWILKKWEECGRALDINQVDHNGRSSLYLVCFKGYLGAEGMVGKTPETQKKRIECVKLLLRHGADVNFQTARLHMTPLHWASYQSDEQMVELLLASGAKLVQTKLGDTPVDMAGFCDEVDTVMVFCRDLQKRISEKMESAPADAEVVVDEEARSKLVSNQVQPEGITPQIDGNFELDAEGRKIVKCIKYKRQQLNEQEAIDIRIFYWAAFYGKKEILRIMIEDLKWSPFIKSFKLRSVVSSAILGSQVDTVRFLVGGYKYSQIQQNQLLELAKTVFNKDSSDNNCLHYSYMTDLPEVRQILRDADLVNVRSQRLNRKGQLPSQLRHFVKVEDSAEDTDEDNLEVLEMKGRALDDLMIVGRKVEGEAITGEENQEELVEEFLAGKTDFDVNNKEDKYRLVNTHDLTMKQKLAHFKSPDYCIVVRADTLFLFLSQLRSLVSRGGVYYSIYDKIETPEDFNKMTRSTDTMMVVLYFDDSVIDLMGEILNIECRLSQFDCQLPFRCYAGDMFDQFNARQQQTIILETLQQEMDLDYLRKSGVILDHFPVHMPERQLIYQSWLEYRWRLSWGMIYRGFLSNMQPLNFIKDYYGEKFGFYFAWLIHYTGWLIPAAIIGVILGIAMIVEAIQEEKEFNRVLTSPISILYGICIMVWITLFHESWKRKQNYIGNEWLVRDFQDATTERNEFLCEYHIDPVTQHQRKISVRNSYLVQLSLGVPVSLIFMCIVIGAQVLLQYANYTIGSQEDAGAKPLPVYLKYIPAVINSLFIIIFGKIYKWLALKLVAVENHRYEGDFENSIANKTYMFQFINTYISNFVVIVYNQNYAALTTNLAIVMLFKQVFINSYEFFSERITIGKKIKKVDELFTEPLSMAQMQEDELGQANIKMHQMISRQLQMKPATSTLVYFYNEGVIQLGFIAFFATAFPFAPLFSFLTNLLEIMIKMQHIARYGRRNFAQGTSGIGNWTGIMNFVSFVAIPINVLILLLCRFPKQQVGVTQDLDGLTVEEESPMVQYFVKRDPYFWNRANIVLFCIFLEHIVIGLKIVIAMVIPDVPRVVTEAEKIREQVIKKAQHQMRKMKREGKYETFEEIQQRLEHEAEQADKPDELIVVGEEDANAARLRAASKKRQKLKEASDLRRKAMEQQRAKNQKTFIERKKRQKREKKNKKGKKSDRSNKDEDVSSGRLIPPSHDSNSYSRKVPEVEDSDDYGKKKKGSKKDDSDESLKL